MPHESHHAKVVSTWLEICGQDADAETLDELFCLAFNTIWHRAKRTLGEVTLTAIGDRAIFFATERYPFLGPITLEQDGIRCEEFRAKAAGIAPDELKAAMAYVLTEFLTVLGRLTAEILSSALHAELATITAIYKGPVKPVKPQGDDGEEGTPS